MAALISAPEQTRENRYMELQEKINQFDIQCVRTDEKGVAALSIILDGFLSELSINEEQNREKRKDLLTTLYKMIGKTRDIQGGKGEYTLSYMMIWTWYKFYPRMAALALFLFVFNSNHLYMMFSIADIGIVDQNDQIPYGSWKDIKYFCDYAKKQGATTDHDLIKSCILFINSQLHLDDEGLQNGHPISLAGKWAPRESSDKFGWLFEPLATNYFEHYMQSAKTDLSKTKALKKCKAQYRTLCTKLNYYLDTIQIKQAANTWSKIDHSKTTYITMARQRKVFLNQTKDGDKRSDNPDRVKCAENLRSYLVSLENEGEEPKNKNGIADNERYIVLEQLIRAALVYTDEDLK